MRKPLTLALLKIKGFSIGYLHNLIFSLLVELQRLQRYKTNNIKQLNNKKKKV